MTRPLWQSRELCAATDGTLSVPFDATGVSIDTRTLSRGDLFVALVGEGRDGHSFVAEALAKGAAGAMVHAAASPDVPLLRVDDTLTGLARLGGFARARFGEANPTARLVAVTGSVGKTTTKEMLRGALGAFGVTHASVASYNNHWGLPLTLARIPHGASFCVAEIGMNHAGEIAPLARLARPHVAVITTIAKAHVGHLGSIDEIADEKASIMCGLTNRRDRGASRGFAAVRAPARRCRTRQCHDLRLCPDRRCPAVARRWGCRWLAHPCRRRGPHIVAAA